MLSDISKISKTGGKCYPIEIESKENLNLWT